MNKHRNEIRRWLLFKWYDIEWWFSDLNPLEWSMITFIVSISIIVLILIF